MKKKALLSILVCSLLFVTGCEFKLDFKAPKNDTTTTTTVKEFGAADAIEVLKNKYGSDDGINYHLLDTVTVEGKTFYKIDMRRYNSGGANSRLDVFFVAHDGDHEIIDQYEFKKKYNIE